MSEIFKEITIDNELNENEKKAIDNIKTIKSEDLQKALTTETIAVKDSPENKKMTFMDIADAFVTYKVNFPIGTVTQDDLGNDVVNKSPVTYDEKAPLRLKNLVSDKDQNDFAYILNVVSHTLTNSNDKATEIDTFGLETMKQLTELKKIITAPVVVPAESTTAKPTPEVVPAKTETTPEVLDLLETDVNDVFTKYGIKKADIVVAIHQMTDKTLANKIIPLLKAGDVKAVQVALGMSATEKSLTKKADGKFGKKSLANLQNGGIVEGNKINTQPAKPTNTTNSNTEETIVNGTVVKIDNEKILNTIKKISTNKEEPKEIEKIKVKKTTDKPTIKAEKKETKKETKKEGKIVEKDENGNSILTINDIKSLPNKKDRSESTIYKLIIGNNEYSFYKKGICKIFYGNKMTWKATGDVKKEIENPPTLAEEMTKYIQKNVKSGFQAAEYETNNYAIFLGGNEKYKDAIHIDTKNKKISYLGINLDFSNDYKNEITKEELFYVAAKSYALINQKANDSGKFYINDATGALHFDNVASSPLISRSDLWDRMPTVLDEYKWNWLLFLNKCQDKI